MQDIISPNLNEYIPFVSEKHAYKYYHPQKDVETTDVRIVWLHHRLVLKQVHLYTVKVSINGRAGTNQGILRNDFDFFLWMIIVLPVYL